MTRQSLLAHVVAQFASRRWEDVATEALLYLLDRPGAQDAVRDALAPCGFELPAGLRWRSQASEAADTSRPDLVADDNAGRHVLVVEVKFWAGLTPNQPLGYLKRQARHFPDEPASSLLLFLAPQRRLDLLTAELQLRLGVSAERRGSLPVLAYGQQLVALLSWSQVLAALETAFTREDDQEAIRDLAQLRGLCDRADSEAVLPLGAEDVDPERGRRFYEYCDVVDRATDRLVGSGTVDTKRLKATGAKGWYGRYVRTETGQVLRFYVSASRWGSDYPTPWWLRFWQATPELAAVLRELLAAGVVAHVDYTDGLLVVGLHPPLQVEGDRIVDELVAAVTAVCEALPATASSTEAPADALDATASGPE